MELRQLRYLVALSQELNFTSAAAKVKVAQPALSRQIRKLEDELGTTLVDRTTRRVNMTSAGARLVERAVRIFDEIDDLREELGQEARLDRGHLEIGTTQTPGPLDIARLLHSFHTLHPGIELYVREELSMTVADRLRADEIEIGFVSEIPKPGRLGLKLLKIASEPLVLALPTFHQLASRPELDLRELQDEGFILFPEGATIRSTFDQVAASHGITPRVAFVTTDTDRMRELVALGLGIGLLPMSDADRPGQPHATARIRDERLIYNVYMAWRSNRRRSPAAIAMASLVESRTASSSAPIAREQIY
jgi:LysR family transcriptional activator of glutamate synthase operon